MGTPVIDVIARGRMKSTRGRKFGTFKCLARYLAKYFYWSVAHLIVAKMKVIVKFSKIMIILNLVNCDFTKMDSKIDPDLLDSLIFLLIYKSGKSMDKINMLFYLVSP